MDESISLKTRDRAETAKKYIEQKYFRLRNEGNERKIEWNTLNRKMRELELDRQEKKMIEQEIMHREATHLREKRKKMTTHDFESIKVIGKGAFGEVRLVRHKATGSLYAMKSINKRDMIDKKQVKHIRTERDILSAAANEWIIKLHYSFQDKSHLYLVMEYLPGGDFMNLLIRQNILSELEAKFYIAELVLAVEGVHKLNYIHRDLKPDNILIDRAGHLKLSDFGLSKEAEIYSTHQAKSPYRRTRKLAFSTVGTPDYIAPEVFNRQGYSESVDWWSVGIILFETVVGYPPFYSEIPSEVYSRIVGWREYFHIPSDLKLSVSAKDLICRLICDPSERLSVEGVKKHPFFLGINWDKMKKTRPPFTPRITDELDTQNFDDFEEPEPHFPAKSKTRQDLNFIGYSYSDDIEGHKCPLKTAIEELEAISLSNKENVYPGRLGN